jgi:putative serine protease PepD
MSMTFEPFTSARVPEQGGHGGRRRAGESGESPPSAVPADPWRADWAQTATPRQESGPQWVADPGQPWAGRPAPQWDLGAGLPVAGLPVADETRVAARDARSGRSRTFVLGLVALLVVVAGWQAYRIEGMTGHNAVLAADLAAEKDRTDKMAKQLAGVFDPETISSAVMPSVFRVRAGDFTGTAFSVGKASGGGSNLFTNYHVVAELWTGGGRTVSLERGSTKISATIQKVSKSKDLALLHTTQQIAGLTTAGAVVKPGQPVVVVGAPLGLDDSVTTGGISAYRPNDPDGPTIQFDAPINPGNSGGPVVNANEQVVGLATAKVKDAEGIGLAIPIKTACDTFKVC